MSLMRFGIGTFWFDVSGKEDESEGGWKRRLTVFGV